MSECRACPARIVWARTPAGKLMPLDTETDDPAVEPVPVVDDAGNVAVRRTGDRTFEARVLTTSDVLVPDEPAADEWRTRSHFATCPGWGTR